MASTAELRPLDINILPEEHRPRGLSTQMIVLIAAAALLVLGLIAAYVILSGAQHRTDDLRTRLSQAKEALADADASPAQLEEVEKQIEQTRAQKAHVQEMLGTLGQRRTLRSACVSDPVVALASGVRVVGITQDGDACIVTGEARSKRLALDYARAIRSRGQFANVFIVSLNEPDPESSIIEMTIRLER